METVSAASAAWYPRSPFGITASGNIFTKALRASLTIILQTAKPAPIAVAGHHPSDNAYGGHSRAGSVRHSDVYGVARPSMDIEVVRADDLAVVIGQCGKITFAHQIFGLPEVVSYQGISSPREQVGTARKQIGGESVLRICSKEASSKHGRI